MYVVADRRTAGRYVVHFSSEWISCRPEFKEAFSLYDKQGTGTVDSSCIGDLLRAVGQVRLCISGSRLSLAISSLH
jgi:hypothetical protein